MSCNFHSTFVVVPPTSTYAIRSGCLTPLVLKSWLPATRRIPYCYYFILCLLLLDAIPQTKHVAFGLLLDSDVPTQATTTPENSSLYHKQANTRKLVVPTTTTTTTAVNVSVEHNVGQSPAMLLAGDMFNVTHKPTGARHRHKHNSWSKKIERFDQECKYKRGSFVRSSFENIALVAVDTANKHGRRDAVINAWSVAKKVNARLVMSSYTIHGKEYIYTLRSSKDFIEEKNGDVDVYFCDTAGPHKLLTYEQLKYIQQSLRVCSTKVAVFSTLLIGLMLLCMGGLPGGMLATLLVKLYLGRPTTQIACAGNLSNSLENNN
eukprot:GHVS01008740.1.p1 GENE.GHVS01008740.1~~GHVS01008740.1.p1  ORF type:complete len:329 (-),score=33.24 GHVS01008740.1:350-1309(-)